VQLVDPALFGTLQDPSFQGMTEKMFPMTAEQIRAFREVYETTKRITAEPPRTPPRPTVSSQTISLSPGTIPPVIRLANGYVSSIVFVDETGAPWPVSAYSVGNPGAFNIQWDTESNLLLIQGQGAYVSGNMAVTLKKLDTPIMLTIVSEQNVVDYRVDFRVQGRGPNANGSIIASTLPQNNSQLLMNLLDGVPPSDAKALEVSGGPAQAWLRGNTLLLRTPLTVLSPGWTATMSSPDGTKVYQMNSTPMILVSDRGQSVALKVKGL
jgi:intracellular multiplication protein IcmK